MFVLVSLNVSVSLCLSLYDTLIFSATRAGFQKTINIFFVLAAQQDTQKRKNPLKGEGKSFDKLVSASSGI